LAENKDQLTEGSPYTSVRLGFSSVKSEPPETKCPSNWLPIVLGMAIGLLSGLTGVGGGIFLSLLLLLMGWATVKETAAVSAAFILVNSVAGLLGYSKNPTASAHQANHSVSSRIP
jgi:uncharacterized protein